MFFTLIFVCFSVKQHYFVKIDVENINPGFATVFDTTKSADSDDPEYLITNKQQNAKEWKLDCTVTVPLNNIHVYENIKNSNESNNFLFIPDYLMNDNIIEKYLNLGFSPVSKMLKNQRYILSSEDQPGYSMLPYTYSILQAQSSAMVYSKADSNHKNPICHKLDFSFYKNICYISALIYTVLMIFRLYYYYLPINLKDDLGSRFWFVSKSKIALTSPARLSYSEYRELYKLIDKAETTNSSQQKVLRISRTKISTELYHLFVYPIFDYYFVIYWVERFAEIAEPLNKIIEGSHVQIDDSYETVSPPIEISYKDGYPQADITLKHFDKSANIHISSTVTNDLPFGSYSLHLAYIDCMHLGIINQISYIAPTQDAFKVFIENIFNRLDFASLDVITITGNHVEEIMKFYRYDDIQPIVDSIIRKMPTHKGPSSISQKHIGDYMFITDRFQVANVVYVVLTGQIANHLSLCVSENTFHFIMSLLVSYHHSVLSTRGDARSLMRVQNLLERTEIFSLIECVGSPSHFLRATGKLYDLTINQEVVDKFLASVSPDVRSRLIATENRQELNSYVVMFTRENGMDECVSISSTSYFDETIAQNIYLYLVEDVSRFHRRAQKLRAAHDDFRMASEFLGLHKVYKNMALAHPTLLSLELGYNGIIASLNEVIYEEDKNIDLNSELTNQIQVNIRLVSSLGYPINYSVIKAASDGNFFIFASRELRQLRAISSDDLIKQESTANALESDFVLILSDLTSDDATVVDSAGKLPSTGNIKDIISLLTNKAPHETVNTIQAKMQNVKDGTIEYASFDAQLAGKIKTMTWYKFIIAAMNDKMILFVYNNNTKKQSLLAMSDMMRKAESFLGSTKMFYWFFEDANEPKRTFTKPPMASGQITFNWSSIESVIREDDRKRVSDIIRKAIDKKGEINAKVVLTFDKPREYLLRGSYNNDILCGIATNVNWISKSIRKTKDAIAEEKKNAEIMKVVKHENRLRMFQIAMCLKDMVSAAEDVGYDGDLVNIVVNSFEKVQQLI